MQKVISMKFGISTCIMIMMGKRHPGAVQSNLFLQERVIETLRILVRRSQSLLCRVNFQRLKKAI